MTIFNYSFSKKYEKRQINKKLWRISIPNLLIAIAECAFIYWIVESEMLPKTLGWYLYYGSLISW